MWDKLSSLSIRTRVPRITDWKVGSTAGLSFSTGGYLIAVHSGMNGNALGYFVLPEVYLVSIESIAPFRSSITEQSRQVARVRSRFAPVARVRSRFAPVARVRSRFAPVARVRSRFAPVARVRSRFAPKGQSHGSPGQRPGDQKTKNVEALKGRNRQGPAMPQSLSVNFVHL